MSRTKVRVVAFAALAGAVLLLTPATSQAQRRGWGWGPGGYDPWGYHSGGSSAVPSATVTQPAPTVTPPSYQANYPAEKLTPSATGAAGIEVRLPDPNAQVWFGTYATKQQGNVREFVSTSGLDPNSTYTYQVRARWLENGRPVEQTRSVTFKAGQQASVDFTTPATK